MQTAVRKEIPDWLSQDSYDKIRTRVSRVRGAQLDNFLSHPVFEALVRETFDGPLQREAAQLVREVRGLVEEVLKRLLEERTVRFFPRLAEALQDEVKVFLDMLQAKADEYVQAVVISQRQVFTQDNEYSKLVECLCSQIMETLADTALGTFEAK